MALSLMVGIPSGLIFPFFLAMLILFSERALYPLRFKEHTAFTFLASVSHNIWSISAVRLPLLDVTFFTANVLAS